MRAFLQILTVGGCLLWFAPGALGHDSRPLFIDIQQLNEQSVVLAWKVPSTVNASALPKVRLSDECVVKERATVQQNVRYQNQLIYVCASALGPESLSIEYPEANPSLATIVRIQLISSKASVLHASPNVETIVLRGSGGLLHTINQYGQLGAGHIMSGYDHLLFVACLVLMAGDWRRIFWSVSGFTLAHSMTLAVSTLGIWRLPIVPAEAVIALSILFLAVELYRSQTYTIAWRYPGMVALLFGLLHGFGFAAVLQDIGCPAVRSLQHCLVLILVWR